MALRIPFALGAYVFGTLGVFLLAAPWSAIWETATISLLPTAWGGIARAGWLRGFVSGLGLLNLAVAAADGLRLWRSLGTPPPGGTEEGA